MPAFINRYKILVLVGEPERIGGGELSLVDFIKRLKNKCQFLCVVRKDSNLFKFLRPLKIELIYCKVNWSRKGKYIFLNLFRLLYLLGKLKLKRFKPSLIFCNAGQVNPFGVYLGRILNTPVISYVQDIFTPSEKDKFLFSKADLIIANSSYVARLVSHFQKNMKVIHPGIDSQRFSPQLKESEENIKFKLNLSDYFLIGNIGTITYKKGFFEFVEVAERVIFKINKVKFIIAGEPKPQEVYILEELKNKIKEKGLEDYFIFLGFVEKIEFVLSGLDVLLFLPHFEAFGRVIIEAFACKTLVIASDVSGPSEIIEDKRTGFLFSKNDFENIAECIVKVYNDKELYKKIVDNAYKEFLEKYTLEKMAEKIDSVFSEYIENY